MKETPARKSIKEWETEDRPREKMLKKGAAALTKAELIAILLQSGTPSKSAVDVAQELLSKSGNDLNLLARAGFKSMTAIKGIGTAKAITLMAALELGRRKQLDAATEKKSITSSREAANLLQPTLRDLPHEVFMVLYLDTARHVIFQEQISTGGLASTVVDVRLIMKHALEWLATSIILAHNHPSGNNEPSRQDESLTRKIVEAAHYLQIEVADHIIIAGEKYFSFADERLL